MFDCPHPRPPNARNAANFGASSKFATFAAWGLFLTPGTLRTVQTDEKMSPFPPFLAWDKKCQICQTQQTERTHKRQCKSPYIWLFCLTPGTVETVTFFCLFAPFAPFLTWEKGLTVETSRIWSLLQSSHRSSCLGWHTRGQRSEESHTATGNGGNGHSLLH